MGVYKLCLLFQGFFIMGKRGFDQQVQTGLPAGQYCDLISNCQQKITVDGSGNARVRPYSNSDPVVAIIQGIWRLLLDRHFESFSESHSWEIDYCISVPNGRS